MIGLSKLSYLMRVCEVRIENEKHPGRGVLLAIRK
jgi:hypothetical protein